MRWVISKLKKRFEELSEDQRERLRQMAWEDRTPFEDIELQFGFSANETEEVMRWLLDEKSYNRWRRRAGQQGHLKHRKKRPVEVDRYKCSRQRLDGSTKGWK